MVADDDLRHQRLVLRFVTDECDMGQIRSLQLSLDVVHRLLLHNHPPLSKEDSAFGASLVEAYRCLVHVDP